MKFVIQRVSQAELRIEGEPPVTIGAGLVVLMGIHREDTAASFEKMSEKILKLRIFADDKQLMNLSVKDIGGEILLVSQFTLFGNCKGQNRPSFLEAARPEVALPLYDQFVALMKSKYPKIKTGTFAADMKIHLTNDGPVTIILDEGNV